MGSYFKAMSELFGYTIGSIKKLVKHLIPPLNAGSQSNISCAFRKLLPLIPLYFYQWFRQTFTV